MLFTGYSENSIDSKGRLAVPFKYRDLWQPDRDGNAWYVLPCSKSFLRLYTENYFQTIGQTTGKPTLLPDRDTADREALLFSSAERIEMDSAGRIMLPKRQLELTGLKNDVAVIGAGNRIEIHDLARWKARIDDPSRSLEELIERSPPSPR